MNSKRKTKVHDVLFSQSSHATPIKTEHKPRKAKAYMDPVTGVSVGFGESMDSFLSSSFFEELQKDAEKSRSNLADDQDDDPDVVTPSEQLMAKHIQKSAERDSENSRKAARLDTEKKRATVMMNGVEVPIQGMTQAEVDAILKEEQLAEDDDEIDFEDEAKRLGLTQDEIDSGIVHRIEMPKTPAIGTSLISLFLSMYVCLYSKPNITHFSLLSINTSFYIYRSIPPP